MVGFFFFFQINKMDTSEPEIFIACILLPMWKTGAYITHIAAEPLSDITEG